MNTQQPVEETMKRGEFLRSLGLSSGALMALYCMGTLSSCGSKDDTTVTPGGGTGTGTGTGTTGFSGNADTSKGTISFTLDLTATSYTKLKTEGEYVSVGDLVVANAKGGKLVAVGRICPHEGGSLGYRLAQDDFQCNLHQSEFGTDGSLQVGPAAKGVKAYKATLSANGNSLQVTE